MSPTRSLLFLPLPRPLLRLRLLIPIILPRQTMMLDTGHSQHQTDPRTRSTEVPHVLHALDVRADGEFPLRFGEGSDEGGWGGGEEGDELGRGGEERGGGEGGEDGVVEERLTDREGDCAA